MTRPSPYVISLSDGDRAVLEARSRAYTGRYADVVRARIVLLAAGGECNTAIAERLDVHVGVVSRWRKRFYESGLDGLVDRARSGRERSFPAPVVAEVKAMACEPPEKRDVPLSRWSSAELAAQAVAEGLAVSVSASTIRRWLHEDAIKPWQHRLSSPRTSQRGPSKAWRKSSGSSSQPEGQSYSTGTSWAGAPPVRATVPQPTAAGCPHLGHCSQVTRSLIDTVRGMA
jgi:transposase